MKDYMVLNIYGAEESCSTLSEAKRIGKDMLEQRPDCDPIIDQYEDEELTGDYWKYKNGKFIKAEPPISLKTLIR